MLFPLKKGAVIAALVLIGGLSCDDNPTESDNPPGTDASRHFQLVTVIKEVDGDFLTVFDVPADTIIDTVNIGRNFDNLAVSPDNSLIFASSSLDNRTVVYSTDSLVIDTVLPVSGKYFIDSDRNLAVRVSATGFTPMTMFPFTDQTPVVRFVGASTVDLSAGVLYLAGLSEPESSWLHRYSYVTSQLVDSTLIVDDSGAALFMTELFKVPNRNRLYFYAFNNAGNYAVIYDTDSMRILSKVSHRVPVGRFALSADGLSVYKSDPDLSSVFTSGYIWRYDIASDRIVDSLSTIASSGTGTVTMSATFLAVSPDGQFLYSSGTTRSLNDGALLRHRLSDGTPTLVPTDLFSQGAMLMVIGQEIISTGP